MKMMIIIMAVDGDYGVKMINVVVVTTTVRTVVVIMMVVVMKVNCSTDLHIDNNKSS